MRPIANNQKEETEEEVASLIIDYLNPTTAEELIAHIQRLNQEVLGKYPDLLPYFKISNKHRERSIGIFVKRLETDAERDKRVNYEQDYLDRRYDDYLYMKKEFEEWERVK